MEAGEAPILLRRGRWQRAALTEGASHCYGPSTVLRTVPLPLWGRIGRPAAAWHGAEGEVRPL
jgi:hypothetical protein